MNSSLYISDKFESQYMHLNLQLLASKPTTPKPTTTKPTTLKPTTVEGNILQIKL